MEYELRYAGKMRKEDLLADEDGTFAVPLQVEKTYTAVKEKVKLIYIDPPFTTRAGRTKTAPKAYTPGDFLL